MNAPDADGIDLMQTDSKDAQGARCAFARDAARRDGSANHVVRGAAAPVDGGAPQPTHRGRHGVGALPDESEIMTDAERYQLSFTGRRKRIAEIFRLARRYQVWKDMTPGRLRALLEELGPMFVKMGQILANRSEILPQRYLDELGKLRTEVEPVPFAVVRDCLRAEYGRPLDEIFTSIDEQPLGSASLAQVHRARLVSGGEVAVKVQRPGAQQIMAQDIDIMRSLARHISRFIRSDQFIDLRDVVEELWQSFRDETNFLVEAHNLDEFYALHVDVPNVSCPRPHMRYCTEHLVVMDYIDGISISRPDELARAGVRLREVGESIVEDYAKQVLDDGFFHADPHAGNIILKDGAVFFIDLGMVGRMSVHDRTAVRDICAAVAGDDVPALKDAFLRIAVSRGDIEQIDHAAFLTDLDGIVQDFGGTDLRSLDIGSFLTALINLARKNRVELPGVMTLYARGMVTMEGLLCEYLPDVNMIQIISDHIARENTGFDRLEHDVETLIASTGRAIRGQLESAEHLGLAARMLTRGQLKLNARLMGSEDLFRHLGVIVDRLSMAIVIAGLFIGSSIVYYAKIEPVIFGIPVIGFLGYASALILALSLGREIWRNSHSSHR